MDGVVVVSWRERERTREGEEMRGAARHDTARRGCDCVREDWCAFALCPLLLEREGEEGEA